MRIRFIVLFLIFTFVSVVASAAIVNGNVGNKGTKKYSLSPGINGWLNLVLTNTAAAADLDLYVTFVDSNGQEQGLANSTSNLKQLEKLTTGVNDFTKFYIYVDSYSGASAYRLAITLEGEVTSSSAAPAQMQLREVPMDLRSQKVIQSLRTAQRSMKQ